MLLSRRIVLKRRQKRGRKYGRADKVTFDTLDTLRHYPSFSVIVVTFVTLGTFVYIKELPVIFRLTGAFLSC
jgi:hypothetical protein